MAGRSGALAHLTAHYYDSDVESEVSDDSFSNSPSNMAGVSVDLLNNHESDGNNLDSKTESAGASKDGIPFDYRPLSPVSFHLSLQGKSQEEIFIPPEAPGKPSDSLIEKISRLHEKMRRGQDMKESIEKRKDFRNPSIYEKLVSFCGIDELGTNYPPDIYNPHQWGPESYYDELAKRQKDEMEVIAKQKKEKTKVEILTGTKAKKPGDLNSGEERKKTKWDNPPNQTTSNPALPLKVAGVHSILSVGKSVPNFDVLKSKSLY